MATWNDVNAGDLVTVTKGETVLTGRVKGTDLGDFRIAFDDRSIWLNTFDLQPGWFLEVLERATIPLPTVPGIYEDKEGGAWRVNAYGEFHYLSSGLIARDTLEFINSHPENYTPFDRLVLEKESN